MEVSFLKRPAGWKGSRGDGNPPATRAGRVVEVREKGSKTGMCSGLCNQMQEEGGTPLRHVTVAEGHGEPLGARSRPKKHVARPGSSQNWPDSRQLATSPGTLGAGATRDAKPVHSRAARDGLKVNLRTEAG